MKNSARFWTGSTWSYEYPDAEQFKTALAANIPYMRLCNDRAIQCVIVKDYGLETEKEV